jgi:hypothetical protein
MDMSPSAPGGNATRREWIGLMALAYCSFGWPK